MLGELPGEGVCNCALFFSDLLTLSPALLGAHRWPIASSPSVAGSRAGQVAASESIEPEKDKEAEPNMA